MKNMFSQIFKSSLFNHAKRMVMAVVFLSSAAIATAGGSNGWTARYYVENVKIMPGSTGSGLVYASTTNDLWNDDSSNDQSESSSNYGNTRGTVRQHPKNSYLPTTYNQNDGVGRLTFSWSKSSIESDTYEFTEY